MAHELNPKQARIYKAMQIAEHERFKGLSKETQDIMMGLERAAFDRRRKEQPVCGQACKDGSACKRKASMRRTTDGIAVQACSTHAEAARYNVMMRKYCDRQIASERDVFAKELAATREKYMRLLRERDEACETRVAELKRHHESMSKAGAGGKKKKVTRRSTRKKR